MARRGGSSSSMSSKPCPTQRIQPVISRICAVVTRSWATPSKGGADCPPLGLTVTTAGGNQKVLCWHTQGILRLIQSIPSPKAEPFKRWLAQVGYERLQEIENPEIAARRMKEIYRQKGYSEAWIERRMRGIAVRDELTDEWKKRGVKEHLEYAILTWSTSPPTSTASSRSS